MSLIVDIKKRYSGFTLDVSFEMEKMPLGILGASGSGKSMTLKCIAGIITPDEGRIEVDGRVLYDSKARINLRPQVRRVGYLLQNHALFPNMTVEKNIAEALDEPNREKGARIEQLLHRFELDGLGKRYPSQLSGGQQQRVAVARVLASEPDVLLLDEPFSALDAYLKESLQLDMKNRLEDFDGYAVMVTHDREEVYKLCPSLMLLEHGQVDNFGLTADLFKQPGTVAAARLTGCKNLSRATKKDDLTVFAEDWNLTLKTADAVPDDLTHIGVRAHAFKATNEDSVINKVTFDIRSAIETPFEWNILIQPDKGQGAEPIWWMLTKESQVFEKPAYLTVAPEDVLLLTGGNNTT